MKRIVPIVAAMLIGLAASQPLPAADSPGRHTAIAETWFCWPAHFPCLRLFGCYPPELPPLTPPSGPNVPGPHCGPNRPC